MVTREQVESDIRNVFKNQDSYTNGIRWFYKVVSTLTLLSMPSEWGRIGDSVCPTAEKRIPNCSSIFINIERKQPQQLNNYKWLGITYPTVIICSDLL